MKLTTPEDFKEAFVSVVRPIDKQLRDLWDTAPKYTEKMIAIMPEIAKAAGLEAYNGEYYYLDTIFYERKDTKYFPANTTYVEYIAVAVEHENQASGTAVEINKLQLFNTPLKVLITYPGNDAKGLLERYSDIMRRADVFGDFSRFRRQLVVFGTYDDLGIVWTFFKFNGDNFTEM